MEHNKYQLPLARAANFFHAVQDEDCFTVFWELADYSPEPVPFEAMRKTFGADPKHLTRVLGRLEHLGIVRKAGRHWTVCDWARTTLEVLEDMMKETQIDVAEPTSPGTGIYVSSALEIATQDGFWVGTVSHVTAGDRIAATTAHTATDNDAIELKSPELVEKPQNEARSHDYK